MRKSKNPGEMDGLHLQIEKSAWVSFSAMWVILSVIGKIRLRWTWPLAVLFGLAATLLHLISEIWHQLGHAQAAGLTGFPMRAIRLWGLLSTSVYPENEPSLSADIHLQRALGGPIASTGLSLVAGLIVLITRPIGGVWYWLARFLLAENVLVFTLGALTPLGFTDGSTLLHWWPQRGRRNLTLETTR